jgi:hypothetical protein
LIKELIGLIDKLISTNAYIKLDENTIIHVYYEPDDDQINIIFWISRDKPLVSLGYTGIRKICNAQSQIVKTHTWELSRGTPYTNYKEHADKYINAYLQQDKFCPDDNFLILHMFQNEYYSSVLYGRFQEIRNVGPFYTDAFKKCPVDYYPVEIRYPTTGWFVWVKKTAWSNGKVTLDDIIFNS